MAPQNKQAKPKSDTVITGEIATVSFRNSSNWTVFSVLDNSNDHPTKINCTGILATICDVGSTVTCHGKMVGSQHGEQLKCTQIVPVAPDLDTEAGVIKLLQRLPGLGPKKAGDAVAEFGPKLAWLCALNHPSPLGVGTINQAEKVINIANSMVQNYDAIVYLLGLGITDNKTNSIIEKYGPEQAIKIVSTSPYQLIEDIDGFGFRIVDGIALKAGMPPGSEARTMACVMFCLSSGEKNGGHVWFWGSQLTEIAETELKESAMNNDVPLQGLPGYDEIRKCIYNLQHERKVIVTNGKVFSRELLEAEQRIHCFVQGTKFMEGFEEWK